MKTTFNRRDFIKSSALAGIALKTAHGQVSPKPQTTLPKFFVFSKHLQFLNYEDMAQAVAEMGFDGADLTVRPNGHVHPDKVNTDLPRATKALQEAGLEVDLFTTAVDDASDPVDANLLRQAAKQGFKRYRMNWYRYQNDTSFKEDLEAYSEKIAELGELNQELGLVGCYQNHAGLLVGASIWEVEKLLSKSDPKSMGAQYDIRHATVEGGLSWENGLRLLKDRIRTIVLKDFRWVKTEQGAKVENTPLGEGIVNFHRFLSLVKELGIDVPISMHMEYDLGGAEKGREKIDIPPQQVFDAMARDLETAKRIWSEA